VQGSREIATLACDDAGMEPQPTWTVQAVAVVRSSREEVVDDDWDAVTSSLHLLPPFDARSVQGLEAFSHLEVITLLDRVDPDTVHVHARRPRGNPAWPEVGILAQRAKDRVNRLGLSTCELVRVEATGDGTVLHVRGLDAVDGTPVLDIKPYMEEFAPRTPVRQPSWSRELMRGYFDSTE
jgi:tRNA-Thr(GGU) m(6)t(6)A37 methyltransferase TsaA